MRRLVRAVLWITLALIPGAALAQTSTATLRVVVPERPLQANVTSSCAAFDVTPSNRAATCTLTIEVVDPTLHNTGWNLSLSATRIECVCGGALPPEALIIASINGPVWNEGQLPDSVNGPKLQTAAVGFAPDPARPLMTANAGHGNGAYAITVTVRLTYTNETASGAYVPTWVAKATAQ